MRCNEVDAGCGPPVVVLIQVRTSGKPFCKFRKHTISPPPKVAHAIAVLAIPFGPARGEVAHLVTPFSKIPRFGNQFYLGDHRVLVDDIEERTQPVYLMQFACKGRSQVETEAVYMHF